MPKYLRKNELQTHTEVDQWIMSLFFELCDIINGLTPKNKRIKWIIKKDIQICKKKKRSRGIDKNKVCNLVKF